MLDTLEGLKKYCEEPLYLAQKKKVTTMRMHDDSTLNARLDAPLNQESSPDLQTRFLQNKASFVISPMQNDAV